MYYGITLSAGSISKEIHLNMFLMGIVEIPGEDPWSSTRDFEGFLVLTLMSLEMPRGLSFRVKGSLKEGTLDLNP